MAKRKVYAHTQQRFISRPNAPWFKWAGERWERIPNTSHRLFVSNYGRVYKEVHRNTKHQGYWTEMTVKLHRSHNGLEIRIKKKPKYHKMVHVIVADLFQLRAAKETVLFKDKDRWNPRLSNLMIQRGKTRWKLTETQKKLCKELFKIYPQSPIITELAERYMVNYKTMWTLYKEFRNENATNGITAYDHLASDYRSLCWAKSGSL